MGTILIRTTTSLLTTLLFPVLAVQGWRVRRRVPRLPEARGPAAGTAGGGGVAGEPLELLLLGESTVAGVGAPDHEQALAGQLAAETARRIGRPVRWRAVGRNGATARLARDRLVPRLEGSRADVVVLALGVNDVIRLRRPGAWARDLGRLVAAVRDRLGPVPVVVAPVPPLECFPALPEPLRRVLGLRARCLNAAARRAAARLEATVHARVETRPGPQLFCEDGVHPSPRGYGVIAEALAGTVAAAVEGAVGLGAE